jgi:GT2 family glycosyltransferase/peptidoglycan/xylan/chitin deacetylase (PgdA/CDA1 family)
MERRENNASRRNARWASRTEPWRYHAASLQARAASFLGVGLNAICGPRAGGAFGILMYHRLSPRIAGVPEPTINVTPRQFRRQMEGLLRRGFTVWPLQRVLEMSAARQPIPERTLVLTFDDAFASVYSFAVPILHHLNLPATIFINTAFVDREEPLPFDHWGLEHQRRVPEDSYRAMTWEQCREVARNPLFELGAHTHTHQDFRGRPEDFRRDLEICVATMRRELKSERLTFAFPYGTPHLGFTDQSLMDAARSTGVICALTTESELVDPRSDPFGWGRLHAFPWDTAATLAAKLEGWYSWAPRQKRRMAALLRRYWPAAAARPSEQAQAPPTEAPPSGSGSGPAPLTQLATGPAEVPAASSGTRPLISVVVPTYNRAHWIGGALQSLVKQDTRQRFDFEILVVDNASTDGTASVVADFMRRSPGVAVHYLRQEIPGDAPTRNAGVRRARGQWLAFFDDDQLAEPGWLHQLLVAAEASGAAIVGGPVHLDLTSEQLARLGPVGRRTLRELTFYPRLQPYAERDLPGTGNALVSRHVFQDLGLFEETMISGGSDSDFFQRARRAGHELWYAPRAVIRHRIPPDRLTRAYLRWDALSGGAGQALHVDRRRKGLAATWGLCCLRVAQAALLHWPRWCWARFRHDETSELGRRIQLWRAEGYLRATLSMIAPRWFAQRSFFEWLEFRQGRKVGQAEGESPTAADDCRQLEPQQQGQVP